MKNRNLNKVAIIKVTPEQSDFLKNGTHSQSKIFRKAVDDLMQKEKLTV